MKKVFKIIIIVLLIAAFVVAGIFIFKKFINKPDDSKAPVVVEIKKLDEIKGFSYYLYDNSTELYKELFNELKTVLETKPIDEEKYAELVSKMFVEDFFTLNNKVTNQDVGGLDFVHTSAKANLKLEASNTTYKYIESNVYGDREQKLPEVSSFVSCVVTSEKYNYTDKDNNISISDDKSYVVKLTWNYKEDLGYQTSATIRLVHEDKVLSIISVKK